MMDVDKVWTEKYRPATLNDIVLSEKNKSILKKFVDQDEIPNLLFCGHAGIGKTTSAKVLINILDAEHIYQNCSEVGIDAVRNDITGFSRTKSFNGKKKIVLLDEIDGMASIEAQRSLRNVLEEYAGHCRFILTCNYKHRVIVPLQSRCQSIDLDPNITEVAKRCFTILKQETIAVDEENKKRLVGLIRKYFPDIRKCINEMQKFSTDGKLTIPDLNVNSDFADKIIKLVTSKKVLQGRKFVIENEASFNGDYPILMKNVFDEICKGNYGLTENQKRMWLVTTGEYMYRSALVLDQEINFYCLLLALSEISA
jgi:DNA polymerase III delta prime subunit